MMEHIVDIGPIYVLGPPGSHDDLSHVLFAHEIKRF